MLESDGVIRIDAGDDWYWLASTDIGLFEAMGRTTNEGNFVDGEHIPTRLLGIDGEGALVAFDEEPQGLDWVDNQASLLMFELPLMPLEDRYQRAGWSAPRVTGSLTGDDPLLMLGQSDVVETRIYSTLLYARRFRDDSGDKVAWWHAGDDEKTGSSRIVRFRFFEPRSPEWERVTEALGRHGLSDADFSDGSPDSEKAGAILAGEFGFALG